MTGKEAIARIELAATEMTGTLATTTEPSAAEVLQRYIDAYDMAIAALREQETVTICHHLEPVTIYRTNADHIRSMTDEELALFLCGVYDEDDGSKFICGYTIPEFDEDRIADWLKAPYEEENT